MILHSSREVKARPRSPGSSVHLPPSAGHLPPSAFHLPLPPGRQLELKVRLERAGGAERWHKYQVAVPAPLSPLGPQDVRRLVAPLPSPPTAPGHRTLSTVPALARALDALPATLREVHVWKRLHKGGKRGVQAEVAVLRLSWEGGRAGEGEGDGERAKEELWLGTVALEGAPPATLEAEGEKLRPLVGDVRLEGGYPTLLAQLPRLVAQAEWKAEQGDWQTRKR